MSKWESCSIRVDDLAKFLNNLNKDYGDRFYLHSVVFESQVSVLVVFKICYGEDSEEGTKRAVRKRKI